MITLRILSQFLIAAALCHHLAAQPPDLRKDLFDQTLLEMDIRFAEENWRNILMKAKQGGDKQRLSAHVTINGVPYENVQIRFKGNSSFHGAVKAGYKKIPLNLKAAEGSVFAGGYETLNLANNYRDPSAIRELLAYRIASDYMPVPRTLPAAVTINGEFFGVYTVTEEISGRMVRRSYCGTKHGLVQCEPEFATPAPSGCRKGNYASLEYLGNDVRCYQHLYVVKEDAEWQHLIRLTRVLSDSMQIVDDVLDIHQTLWMHALNNVLVNLDSYLGFFSHNYYLFRDEHDVYHPLLWDLNLAFGGFHALKEGSEVDFVTLSPIVHDRLKLTNRPLITQLLQDRLYRRLYFAMMHTIVHQWFVNRKYFTVASALQNQLRPYVQRETNTFYTLDDFNSNLTSPVKAGGRSVPGIAELMDARTAYLMEHPLLHAPSLVVENWTALRDGDDHVIMLHLGSTVTAARLFYRTADCMSFTALPLVHGRLPGQFECRIPGNARAFYCELESTETANLWPLTAPMTTIRIE